MAAHVEDRGGAGRSSGSSVWVSPAGLGQAQQCELSLKGSVCVKIFLSAWQEKLLADTIASLGSLKTLLQHHPATCFSLSTTIITFQQRYRDGIAISRRPVYLKGQRNRLCLRRDSKAAYKFEGHCTLQPIN